jgi:hypothetical protein
VASCASLTPRSSSNPRRCPASESKSGLNTTPVVYWAASDGLGRARQSGGKVRWQVVRRAGWPRTLSARQTGRRPYRCLPLARTGQSAEPSNSNVTSLDPNSLELTEPAACACDEPGGAARSGAASVESSLTQAWVSMPNAADRAWSSWQRAQPEPSVGEHKRSPAGRPPGGKDIGNGGLDFGIGVDTGVIETSQWESQMSHGQPTARLAAGRGSALGLLQPPGRNALLERISGRVGCSYLAQPQVVPHSGVAVLTISGYHRALTLGQGRSRLL